MGEDCPNPLERDVSAHPVEARHAGVQATPSILLVEDGEILKALLRPVGLPALKGFLSIA